MGIPSHRKVIFHYEKPPSLLQAVVLFIMATCTLRVVISIPEKPVAVIFSVDVLELGYG
jgi:hypothetical protein